MPSCPRCGRAGGEDASFCSACGARLAGEATRTSTRKTVTVLFSDVCGFTALGERFDPELLREVMSDFFFPAMRGIVARHGGLVDKLIGDEIMALFGVPVVHEDDALRAARAAVEMRAALPAINDRLAASWDVHIRTHTGMDTGEIVVGQSDEEWATYGDTINVAKRLEEVAAPDEILVGRVTAQLLAGVGELTAVEPMQLKGKRDAVPAWRLEAIGDDRRREAASTAALVGRRSELDTLRASFERVVATRSPEMVTVTGPAGIGKSRLARGFLDGVEARAAVVAARCLPYGEGITYWPLAEIVRRLAGRPEEAAIAEAAGSGPEARVIAERLARVTGISAGSVAVEEAHWAARRLLEVRAQSRPLIVVVDDIHWAEPRLLDLLEHVTAFAGDVPLLLLCLARPELLERRPGWLGAGGRSRELVLGPLRDEDAAALLRRLTADSAVEPDDAGRMLATAEGNPFFLEQIVAMRAEPGVDTSGTPASIQALLAARIDALPPVERAVIDRAAVEGRGFHRSAVAELLPAADRPALDATLASLAARQLIRPGAGELPGEAGYRFVHILVRDVVYELLAKATRAELHERYAGWLDERAGPRYGELVGYHLEQAHRWQVELRPGAHGERRALASAAAGRLGAAGRVALSRGDLPGGVNLLERTVALLRPDDPARAPVLPELGLALVQLGRLPAAEAVLVEAVRIAAGRDDALAEAHARTAHFFAIVQMDPEAAADELDGRFDQLHRTFTVAADDLGLARLHRGRALVYWLAGRTAQAAAAWARGERHARRAGDDHGRADALVWLSSAYAAGPTRVEVAIPRCDLILDELRSDRRSQALSMRGLASLHAMAGRFDEARELIRRSNAIHAELGVGMHAAAAHDEAFVELLAGDPATAVAALRPSVAQLRDMGERALLASTAGILAGALVDLGEDAEAWEHTHIAADDASPDDIDAQIRWRSVRARLLAREGRRDEADRLSVEAVELAARTDWLSDQGDAHMARGEVLRALGDADGAAAAFHRAFTVYTRKGNVVSAQRARNVVDAAPARRLGATPERSAPRRPRGDAGGAGGMSHIDGATRR
jgi:class 3 adenylate cyclase/tetratricopeptide (TPR) repeat protein